MSLAPNKVRKHKGIHQTGPRAGRLRKGFRYSGRTLSNGLPEIIEAKNKNVAIKTGSNKSVDKVVKPKLNSKKSTPNIKKNLRKKTKTDPNKSVDKVKAIKPKLNNKASPRNIKQKPVKNVNITNQRAPKKSVRKEKVLTPKLNTKASKNVKKIRQITEPNKKPVIPANPNKKSLKPNESEKEILHTEQSLIDNYSTFVNEYLLNQHQNVSESDIEPIHKLIMNNTMNKMLDFMTKKDNTSQKPIKTKINSNNKENEISFQINSDWNSSAIPQKSSLNKLKSEKKRKKQIKWGNISIRTYEQRAGISSCAVPTTAGPSLYLGSLLYEKTVNINEYEMNKDKNINDDGYEALSKKERIERVKKFRSSDIQKKKLKEDNDEIKSIKKSRNSKKGCDCVSIYKMKKLDVIDKIIHLSGDITNNMKKLKKLTKGVLLDKLKQIQFDMYGRYDVCCIDETCSCVQNDIGCHIDDEACSCGGYVVYNNYLNGDIKSEKKVNKRDSYACGNSNGNTLNVNVLDYVYKEKIGNEVTDDVENDICEIADNGEVKFNSKEVKRILSEWNEYY